MRGCDPQRRSKRCRFRQRHLTRRLALCPPQRPIALQGWWLFAQVIIDHRARDTFWTTRPTGSLFAIEQIDLNPVLTLVTNLDQRNVSGTGCGEGDLRIVIPNARRFASVMFAEA